MRYYAEWGVMVFDGIIYYPDWTHSQVCLHDTLEDCKEEAERSMLNSIQNVDFSLYDWDSHWSKNSHQTTKMSKSGYMLDIDPNLSYYAYLTVRW